MPSASASVASRANGFATPASANGHGGRRGPLPHIDDLTSVAVTLNPHTPLRKFLEVGDKHMRQAVTYNDFRRPDLALQEFITAFTIAVDKIPKHKDYPSLKTGNGDLSRLYNTLKANITHHCTTFDKIKEDIKEDNKRSGVQPRNAPDPAALQTLPSVPSAMPSHMRSNSANGIQTGASAQARQLADMQSVPAGKVKPVVQPKPHALHGNAIRSPAKPGSQELLNRFARLRDPQVPPSGSPTSSPSTHAGADQQQLPRIDSALPPMPKLPDAIYSPARGTVTSETANLPSSTPRGMFSRTNSINSVPSSARNSVDIPIRPTIYEVFVPAHALGDGVPPTSSAIKSHISLSETITPEELKNYMSHGSAAIRLMLVDVRSREDYDEGHIFAQTSICIEPSVLARGEVSASDIEDSLGIAPDEEMHAFESRAQFDLVVFYDQNSSSIPKRPSEHPEEMALYTLYQALVHFDYPVKLRRPPKLLNGGIDAWVDMFGSQSLRESKTNIAAQHLNPRPLQASKTGVKTLAADEIRTWKETAARNQVDYITSTNDFLRRPPARPAPALPRTSYSGVSTREPASDSVFAKSGRALPPNGNLPTGLVNGRSKDPQLMARILGNLIQWLSGEAVYGVESNDFACNRSRHRGYPHGRDGETIRFGDGSQHDPTEYLDFIFVQLGAETNRAHGQEPKTYIRPAQFYTGHNKPVPARSQLVRDSWNAYSSFNRSILDEHWGLGVLESSTCDSCGDSTDDFSWPRGLDGRLGSEKIGPERGMDSAGVVTLEDLLTVDTFPSEKNDMRKDDPKTKGYDCGRLKSEQHFVKTITRRLIRLPRLLCIRLRRELQDDKRIRKIMRPVRFPVVENLDLSGYLHDEFGQVELDESGFRGETNYTLYGVVSHLGRGVNEGHYISYVRQGPEQTWHECNDTIVTARTVEQLQDTWFAKEPNLTPTMLFYKRKDVGWDYAQPPDGMK
ncbi:ubiquitin carboxyl-terminal hydrolase [Apiospora kogelbergensis]|uniref:ubiquitin carboxyl-terminal hydrolase n=1 Tax=Apiospora kogelbergensis TaxID=1337665 RepID=UPI00313199D7